MTPDAGVVDPGEDSVERGSISIDVTRVMDEVCVDITLGCRDVETAIVDLSYDHLTLQATTCGQ